MTTKRRKKPMTINERWERGIAHNPRSVEIYHAIAAIDFEQNYDYFQWKAGGDGDNGEVLMYLLDVYLERQKVPER